MRSQRGILKIEVTVHKARERDKSVDLRRGMRQRKSEEERGLYDIEKLDTQI